MLFTLDDLIDSMKNAKDTAAGPDEIHYQFLKHLPNESQLLLLQIFNDIWKSGEVPGKKLLFCQFQNRVKIKPTQIIIDPFN